MSDAVNRCARCGAAQPCRVGGLSYWRGERLCERHVLEALREESQALPTAQFVDWRAR